MPLSSWRLKKGVFELERVQRRATGMAGDTECLLHDKKLSKLRLFSLGNRRLRLMQ